MKKVRKFLVGALVKQWEIWMYSFSFIVGLLPGLLSTVEGSCWRHRDGYFEEHAEYEANAGSALCSGLYYPPISPSQPEFFGGEFLIDTNVVYSPEPHSQYFPAVVFDGTNYLVVWQDTRGEDDDIYGARVSPDGIVLDPEGISICTAPGDQFEPAVSFDETNYLVVWQDNRNGNPDIYGARVTPEGRVIDLLGIPISTFNSYQWAPAVSFDGTNYLVVWEDRRGEGADIYGARVSPDGIVLDPDGIPISTAERNQCYPAVVFGDTNYLVVWTDARVSYDIYGARVSPDGTVLDSAGIAISTASYEEESPSVGFDGTNYLVVWEQYRSRPYPDIYGARVSPDGTVLDPQGFAISTAAGNQWHPVVAFDGTNSLVVWQDDRNGNPDIYGARVSPEGTVLDPQGIPISTAVNYQEHSAITFDGTNYLVVWEDGRNGNRDIYGVRVSKEGTMLDPQSFAISTAAYDQSVPVVAFDGTNYLVVWQDCRSKKYYRDIYGARVRKDGLVLDPQGFTISTAADDQMDPVVAFDGTNYLVVWAHWHGENWDIYGARVSPDGTVLDPDCIPISTVIYPQRSPSIVFDGTNYLVVWEDYRSGSSYDIYGARVSPDGTVLDPEGIPILTARYPQYSPSVVFDGTNYLVVWAGWRGENRSICGARVSKDGTVLDPVGFVISTGDYEQESPSVVFDGTNYLVVWEDGRNGNYDIYGARVSPDGIVLDSFPVIRQDSDQVYPALSRGTGSQIFLVYQGWAGTVGGKTYNTERIWGKMNPAPGIEERLQPTANGSWRAATIVRNVLKLNTEDVSRNTEHGPRSSVLLDVTGRKVLELKSGANDIRHLSPGVYFIKDGSLIDRKVVITR